jgi:hypothetical protein
MTKSKNLIGKVIGLFLGLSSDSLITTPCEQATVTFTGLEGDKHAGYTRPSDGRTPYYKRGTEIRNDRQVSIVSIEELAEIASAMHLPEVRAEWLGANLCFSGIPKLTFLPPNTRLIFPDSAVLRVSYENNPCTGPGEAMQFNYPERTGLKSLFPKAAIHKRGVVAVVERPGVIRLGDGVKVELANTFANYEDEAGIGAV